MSTLDTGLNLIRTASQRVSAVNDRMSGKLKSWMPTGLYARALLIMIVPMVVLQTVVAFVFMERHWNTVTRRLSAAVVQDIASLIDVYKGYPQDKDRAQLRKIGQRLQLVVDFLPVGDMPPPGPKPFFSLLDQTLSVQLGRQIGRPFWIDTVGNSNLVEIRIQLDDAVMRIFQSVHARPGSRNLLVLIGHGNPDGAGMWGSPTPLAPPTLRTPPTVIRVAADNLANGMMANSRHAEKYGRLIGDEARRLTDMVEQILSFARTQSPGSTEFAPIAPEKILGRALSVCGPALREAGITVERSITPGLPEILVDANQIVDCVQNLLHNATKFTPPGGAPDSTALSSLDRAWAGARGAGAAAEVDSTVDCHTHHAGSGTNASSVTPQQAARAASSAVVPAPRRSRNLARRRPASATTVTWTVSDTHGNSKTCQQTVTVSAPVTATLRAHSATAMAAPSHSSAAVGLWSASLQRAASASVSAASGAPSPARARSWSWPSGAGTPSSASAVRSRCPRRRRRPR
jgi:hypothetical protein